MPALQAESAADLAFPQLLQLALKKLAIRHAKETPGSPLWLDEEISSLHTTLHALQKQLGDRLPPLAAVHFMDPQSGGHPYSREVTEALDILQQAGAVTRENPQYRWLSPTVRPDSAALIGSEVERLFPQGSPERGAFEELVDGLNGLSRKA